jgi:heat-inducible transcriptional repressor
VLSDRRQRVLAALIEEYVSHALPVGSRTLVEHYQLGVSPATVRNELSVLEDAGYIAQPHTSAGRIPTDYGYRSFVDDLLKSELDETEEDEQTKRAVQDLRASASELDGLLEQTSAALTRLTDCLSIVLPPSTLSLHIRQISFVSMTQYRVMIVIVTEDGQVVNRSVDFGEEISSDDLAEAQNLLNHVLAGKSFAEIRDQMDGETATALRDPLVQVMIGEVFACLEQGESGHVHRLGLSTLMQQPEFRQTKALVPVLQVLEDDTVLMKLLQDAQASDETIVRIGHENSNELLSGVSVVASPYGRGDSEGIVAVIGPTRMNYAQVIRAVRVAKQTLDDV